MPIIWHDTRSVRVTIVPPSFDPTTFEASLGITGVADSIVIENLANNEGFEIDFSVTRSMDESLGEIELKIYNLPVGLRGELEAAQVRKVDDLDQILARNGQANGWEVFTGEVAADGASALAVGLPLIKLEAGYDGNVSELFEAVGATVDSSRADETTYVTAITAIEALDSIMYARPTTVFPEGSPTFDLVTWLRIATGLGQGNTTAAQWAALVGDSRLDSPFYANSGGFEGLKQLLDFLPLRWWIDDRQLWIVSKDGQPGATAPPYLPTISVLTEPMVERPKRIEGGFVQMVTLLWASAIPGTIVPLSANSLGLGYNPTPAEIARAEVPPGFYRIEAVEHSGTTSASGDATTTCKLKGGFAVDGVSLG